MSTNDSGPDRYSDGEWQRTKQQALDTRASEAPEAVAVRSNPATLVPGVVAMSLRGAVDDVEQVVAAMRAIGIVVWRANSPGTKTGNQAGYQYFTIEVPGDHRG